MAVDKVFLEEKDHFLMFNIWVTLYCNFCCKYCYETSDKPSVYMNEETADAAISFMLDMLEKHGGNALWINFHGGEPMLNGKIIKYILQKLKGRMPDIKLLTSMTTNCSVWDEEICDLIQEISVSVDGNQPVHDRNRIKRDGSGTYKLIIKNALEFQKRKNGVRLRMVVTPDNVGELYDSIRHLLSLGFREIIPGVDYFNTNWNQELFETLYHQLNKLKKYRKWHFFNKSVIGLLDDEFTKKGQCIVGEDGYQVSVDGKLYPCSYVVNHPDFCIGDVRNGIDHAAVERINCLNNETNKVCEGCSNYSYCISPRCLMFNKVLTGDYYTPSAVVCAVENVKLRLRGLL